MGEYTECGKGNYSKSRQQPHVGTKAGQQARKQLFNNPSLQQSLSEMSQPKATLSPQEENQWTALQIYFHQFCNVNLPGSIINRAAMLRLKNMDVLSDESDAEANIPTAYFTEFGIKYVLNIVENFHRSLYNQQLKFINNEGVGVNDWTLQTR